MGSSKQTQTQSQSSRGSSYTLFDPRTETEKQILRQYQGLGDQQLSFINSLSSGGLSPFALSPAAQADLDKAFEASRQRLMMGGKDYADYLATTRGLNKSDDPVSQQAMERFGMGLADLESQRAQAGLNFGLAGTQMRLAGSQALPAGLGAAFSPLFSERMASGMTHTSGSSRGTSTVVNNPSLMTQIGNGMSLASQGLGLGAQIGGLAMSPMMGGVGSGMGSGAAANSWFGPKMSGY